MVVIKFLFLFCMVIYCWGWLKIFMEKEGGCIIMVFVQGVLGDLAWLILVFGWYCLVVLDLFVMDSLCFIEIV